MLSRIAEALFWIGRYVERVDGTARLVDVVRLAMLEGGLADNDELTTLTGSLAANALVARIDAAVAEALEGWPL